MDSRGVWRGRISWGSSLSSLLVGMGCRVALADTSPLQGRGALRLASLRFIISFIHKKLHAIPRLKMLSTKRGSIVIILIVLPRACLGSKKPSCPSWRFEVLHRVRALICS
ncbi:hypothetical protein BKA61DRAFT_297379 [Leptodontidium sp. MPI-SDFR-AT-0119]|nr:hypothetical protein BKA61DRAFT_297379 [Leptodontidium sp. MPI-SDFR-AT-0119]